MQWGRKSRRRSRCSTHYPQTSFDVTNRNEASGRAEYNRPCDGRKMAVRETVCDCWREVTVAKATSLTAFEGGLHVLCYFREAWISPSEV